MGKTSSSIDGLRAYLTKVGAKWTFDPIFDVIILRDKGIANVLQQKHDCKDVTKTTRTLAEKTEGVRVVGCERFAGMFAYDFGTSRLYHVDAMNFAVRQVVDSRLLLEFRGLGRAAANNVKYDFDSMSIAVTEYKKYVQSSQDRWLSKYADGATSRTRERARRKPAIAK
jgi:hypothetical protein